MNDNEVSDNLLVLGLPYNRIKRFSPDTNISIAKENRLNNEKNLDL